MPSPAHIYLAANVHFVHSVRSAGDSHERGLSIGREGYSLDPQASLTAPGAVLLENVKRCVSDTVQLAIRK